MAEVYWDMEWTLQQQGFDYAYDKRLYDRLLKAMPEPCVNIFMQDLITRINWHDSWKIMMNHVLQQPSVTDKHKAAAVITFFSPGLRFFHQGQFEGRKKRISPHLVRAPQEPVNEALQKFYGELLYLFKNTCFP